MRVVTKTGRDDIALVYVADMGGGRGIEFVESVQPPVPRERKWVLILSTLCGCPVRCRFCDAGIRYRGKLSAAEMLAQADYMVLRRYPDAVVPAGKFKVQFARMGEPAFNEQVIEALDELSGRYDAPGLMPAVSTIAPEGTDRFFERLLAVKRERYPDRFQLQFSIHTTDPKLRNWLVPARTWGFERIAEYGNRFHEGGGRKVSLNFALAEGMPVDPAVLLRFFSPDVFLLKFTPVNPTYRARSNEIVSLIGPDGDRCAVVEALRDAGYEVIVSIGELEENLIGSNCGQYLQDALRSAEALPSAYSYEPRTP